MKAESARPWRRHRIFLSFSRVDKWVPRNYVEPLRQIDGISLFYDGDIKPGEPFPTRIIDSLRSGRDSGLFDLVVERVLERAPCVGDRTLVCDLRW